MSATRESLQPKQNTMKYQKIDGSDLTASQYLEVHDSLMDKFGNLLPSQMVGNWYAFDLSDKFLGVWGSL